jgi:alpha-mannosidase
LALTFNIRTIYYQNQKYDKLYRVLDKFFLPLYGKLNFKNKAKIPFINNPYFTILAIKRMEYSDDLIIRGFNNSEKQIKLIFSNANNQPTGVDSLNLAEKMLKHNINVDIVNKYEIKTYRIANMSGEEDD